MKKLPTNPALAASTYYDCYPLLGIFDLTLAIKLVPNKHVYFYLSFILPTLLNHVDVTLACDDDHQIHAHKTAITGLRMEFLVHGLGFISRFYC